jgi:hypothetical protein
MKKTILISLMVLLLLPTGLLAHEEGGGPEGTFRDLSGFVQDLALLYSEELQRDASSAGLKFYPEPGDDLSFLKGQQVQAKRVAQSALKSVIRQTVEQVDVLHTLKTYGEQMTFSRLRVSSNDVQVSGPSLKDSPEDSRTSEPSKSPILSVRSGMSLTDSIHIAPMIQAHLGDVSSKVVYDPIAGGDWRFSLGRSITSQSTVEMVYLFKSTDDQDLLATLRFSF